MSGLRSHAEPAEAPGTTSQELQVIVAFMDEEHADALAFRLNQTFRRRGFAGDIVYVPRPADPKDEVKPDRPFLALSLEEWRPDISGDVQCNFTATFVTPAGLHELGRFRGTGRSPKTARQDSQGLTDAFEDAARQALNSLYRKLTAEKLLP